MESYVGGCSISCYFTEILIFSKTDYFVMGS